MFCPNCGKDCGDAKFCSECGTKLEAQNLIHAGAPPKTAAKSIYQVNVNGHEINLLKAVGKYGANTPRIYSYLKREFDISKEQAQEILAPFQAQENANKRKRTIVEDVANELQSKAKRETEMDAAGIAYCPKCLSTSVTANQKGFSFGRGAIGAAIGLDVGLIAGGIGSKKIICTCLKCGHQWKPGKK